MVEPAGAANAGPAGDAHPGRVLGALASGDRLRVLAAAVLHGPASAEDLASAAHEPVRAVWRGLEALAAAGLAAQDDAGRWSARPDGLRAAAQRASRLVEPPGVVEIRSGATPEERAVLRSFIVGGRLTRLPAQRSKRLVVLDYLAQRFEPGRTYEEVDVNAVLGRWYQDHATLRRALVDEGFLDRRDGRYWRAGGTFDVG
ncbi:MAG TPA: DUF2087 domain-containing protein [Acidimicrobiales bacterium]|nr:DUF2087 domain-containing protein [Acidimicrobiales bacterium]